MNAIGFMIGPSAKTGSIGAESEVSPCLDHNTKGLALRAGGGTAYGINPQGGGTNPFDRELGETQSVCHQGGVMQVNERHETIGFKAGQSKDGGLGDEREVAPTISHTPSALEPTVAIAALLSQMRYIVRRFTPKEAERLMGLPDFYTIPTGLEITDELVAEFQRIHDAYGTIMYDYAHAKWEREGRRGREPKPPKPKSAAWVRKWLEKITNPATCPDSPRYRVCGNGWATNQPRWILTRLLAIGEGIDPFIGSGTTGVAAIQEGMRFVGIERDAKYMEIARRRIAEAETEVEHESNNPKFIQQELPL